MYSSVILYEIGTVDITSISALSVAVQPTLQSCGVSPVLGCAEEVEKSSEACYRVGLEAQCY